MKFQRHFAKVLPSHRMVRPKWWCILNGLFEIVGSKGRYLGDVVNRLDVTQFQARTLPSFPIEIDVPRVLDP
jgi:hypothetical protein